MSETSAVGMFGDQPEPNTFFFRSPFRSWKFLINTFLVAAVCFSSAAVLWKYWDLLNQHSYPAWTFLLVLLLQNVVYPFWWALKRHGKIKALYLAGDITEQTSISPLNELLEVADNSLNEGLRNTSFIFGVLLVILVKLLIR